MANGIISLNYLIKVCNATMDCGTPAMGMDAETMLAEVSDWRCITDVPLVMGATQLGPKLKWCLAQLVPKL